MSPEERAIVGDMPGVVMSRALERVAVGVRRVVKTVTEQTKAMAKAQVATRLTARAGNLVTAKYYEGGTVGYLHSRWFRGPRGGKVMKASGLGANDILAIHEQGGTIRPARGSYIYIPLLRGTVFTSREHRRRILVNRSMYQEGYRNPYEFRRKFIKLPGNRILVVEGKGKGRGTPIAILVKSIKIPKRLDFAEVKRRALQDLRAQLGGMATFS